jgi:hypothetical protein
MGGFSSVTLRVYIITSHKTGGFFTNILRTRTATTPYFSNASITLMHKFSGTRLAHATWVKSLILRKGWKSIIIFFEERELLREHLYLLWKGAVDFFRQLDRDNTCRQPVSSLMHVGKWKITLILHNTAYAVGQSAQTDSKYKFWWQTMRCSECNVITAYSKGVLHGCPLYSICGIFKSLIRISVIPKKIYQMKYISCSQ